MWTFEDSKINVDLIKKSYRSYKEKSASIILLWKEILNDSEDAEKYGEEFQRSMDF